LTAGQAYQEKIIQILTCRWRRSSVVSSLQMSYTDFESGFHMRRGSSGCPEHCKKIIEHRITAAATYYLAHDLNVYTCYNTFIPQQFPQISHITTPPIAYMSMLLNSL